VSAIQAYNAVVSLLQSARNGNGNEAPNAFKQLGQALQSGNLPAAQQALAVLRQAGPRGIQGAPAAVSSTNIEIRATSPSNGAATHLNLLA
jgi:hypothetical protein